MTTPKINTCIFTGLPVIQYDFLDFVSYEIESKNKIRIRICNKCYTQIIKIPIKDRFFIGGMILNGKIKISDYDVFHIDESTFTPEPNRIAISNIINTMAPPSPQEKIDGLLLSIESEQEFEGAKIPIKTNDPVNEIFIKNLIKTEEQEFYLKSLVFLELIQLDVHHYIGKSLLHNVALTMKGVKYLYELRKSGVNSNVCFIAMSFKNETKEIRESIKAVLGELKYEHILIDEIHIDNEITINDAIIASIRKSKFCISDYTFQSYGVYFESGFALGLGRKVIYTCRRDWFDKSHFDTNHFPHIVYDDPNDLLKKLKDKIEAWID